MGLIFSINREHRRLRKINRENIDKRTFKGCVKMAVVDSIYDGDTITVVTRLHDNEHYAKYSLRLSDIDAPEVAPVRKTTPNWPLHKEAGIAVRDYLRRYLPVGSVIQIIFEKEEKYGRLLGNIHKLQYSYFRMKYVQCDNVNQHLLEMGLVVPYGGNAKETFSEQQLNDIILKSHS